MPKTHFPNGIKAPLSEAGSDVTSLTDNSGGSASDTIAAIGGTYSQTEVQNAVASLAAKINAVISAMSND